MRLWLAVLVCASLAACGERERIVSTPGMQVTRDTSLPAPVRADLVAADRPSLIGPLDQIGVDVFGVSDLSREIQVDASGRISMPLVGQLDARGKTSAELATEIEGRLRGRYIRNPEVTVNIRGSVSQTVTVDGSVGRPGLYPVTNGTTLMRTIAASGGLSEFAREDDVVILRTVNSRRMAGLYNIDAIRKGLYDDPAIYANDVVIVGDSPQRRLFRDALQVAPLLVAPLVAVIQ